ncbi:hypothetical protein AQS8620_01597 [Aquimixticola soesokkakensis]|uniref:DUF1127 domain-containing protein n=1 Tax=Aquimixticola soesokkakensis TaxID=1519096 RepID=A0A1Y5SKZ1_9RHOB|nr:DUF1127 domain-containing protein [Aquimixticola soesokkakensis]SLN41462.1 hypothetical protein AQS8620_01597 [Aquimixticola soesokkakensis]
MATLAQNTKFAQPILGFFAAAAAQVGAFFDSLANANSHMMRYKELDALSDAELAELGLTRNMLVHHVFGSLN